VLALGLGQLHIHRTRLVLCPQLIRNSLRDEYNYVLSS